MLEWIERGIADYSDQKAELEALIKVIEDGGGKHPSNDRLSILRDKLRHAYLSLAVVK